MGQGRGQHYVFAHKALPQLFFEDPVKFLQYLEEDGEKYLRHLWDYVGQNMDEAGLVPPEGLACELAQTESGATLAMLTLPVAELMTEAYFIGLFYEPPGSGNGSDREAVTRFITLEYNLNPETKKPATMVCEWTPDGSHRNLGYGPEPTKDNFLKVLKTLLLE